MVSVFLATTPDQVLYAYGPLGVSVVVLAFAVTRMFIILMKDRDKAFADRDSMVQDLFTKVLPTISRNNEILLQRQELDRELLAVVRAATSSVDDNGKTLAKIEGILTRGLGNVSGDST